MSKIEQYRIVNNRKTDRQSVKMLVEDREELNRRIGKVRREARKRKGVAVCQSASLCLLNRVYSMSI